MWGSWGGGGFFQVLGKGGWGIAEMGKGYRVLSGCFPKSRSSLEKVWGSAGEPQRSGWGAPTLHPDPVKAAFVLFR